MWLCVCVCVLGLWKRGPFLCARRHTSHKKKRKESQSKLIRKGTDARHQSERSDSSFFLFLYTTRNSVLFPKSLNSRTRQGVDRNPLAIGRNRSSSGAQSRNLFLLPPFYTHMHVCVVHPLGLYRQQLHSIFSSVFS